MENALQNPIVLIVGVVVALMVLRVVVELLKNAAFVAALITIGLIAAGVAYFVK